MNKKLVYGMTLGAMLLAPLAVYPVLLMKLLCFVLLACAFNLLLGFGGLLSFGHAALFGGAGYIAGYVLRDVGYPFEIGLMAGVLGAATMGLVMGALAIRRKGIYFTMVTLALAQMVYFFCLQAPFTGGEDGLQNIPRGRLFGIVDLGSDLAMYYVVLAITVAGYVAIVRIVNSPFGRVLNAIKENEPRAISLGYDVDKYKLVAFVLSAALAGLAGATKSVVLGFETLVDVHWGMSGLVVLMTLIGGVGTLTGPIVGALVILVLETRLGELGDGLASLTGIAWFQALGESVTIVTGLIFIICVLLFRRGIVGELVARLFR